MTKETIICGTEEEIREYFKGITDKRPVNDVGRWCLPNATINTQVEEAKTKPNKTNCIFYLESNNKDSIWKGDDIPEISIEIKKEWIHIRDSKPFTTSSYLSAF